MTVSVVPQVACSIRKGGGGRGGFCGQKCLENAFYILCTTSPYSYQESQHVKGFEKSFSKETYLNLFNLVFPKHI